MLNAQLHQLILGNNQRIKLTVDFLLDGAGEKQVSDNRADNTNDNLAAALTANCGASSGSDWMVMIIISAV
jgi:hypothetical protein